MRHAKSSWEQQGIADFDRVLNERGKHDAPEMGKRLRKKNVLPDIILTSPAARAIKTAKMVAQEIGYPDKHIIAETDIYHADIHTLLFLIRQTDDSHKSLMIFGHNPTFTGLVGYLSNEFIENLPTAGVVKIEFDITTWKQVKEHAGKFCWIDFPKNK
jgi:phosphohistidine phosphatase